MEVEAAARYAWIGLLVVLIIAVFAVVISPRFETRSMCTGFQYFVFLDQKASETSYTLQLLNGVSDVSISGMSLDGASASARQDVKAGDTFMLSSSSRGRQNETFIYKISIAYGTPSMGDRQDIATCTGRIE